MIIIKISIIMIITIVIKLMVNKIYFTHSTFSKLALFKTSKLFKTSSHCSIYSKQMPHKWNALSFDLSYFFSKPSPKQHVIKFYLYFSKGQKVHFHRMVIWSSYFVSQGITIFLMSRHQKSIYLSMLLMKYNIINPIQDRPFRGCSRMVGQKGSPIP